MTVAIFTVTSRAKSLILHIVITPWIETIKNEEPCTFISKTVFCTTKESYVETCCSTYDKSEFTSATICFESFLLSCCTQNLFYELRIIAFITA